MAGLRGHAPLGRLNMPTSYLPITQAQASGAWHHLSAGEAITIPGISAPVQKLAIKRHPYDHWSPVTSNPADYPSSVRFAAVLK